MKNEAASKGIAIVTGASSGIGRKISAELAKDGFRIVVDHYRDESGAEETLRLVREAGSDGWPYDADVGSSEELDGLFQRVADDEMPLRVLVNNAAIQTFASLLELDESDFDRTIRRTSKARFCARREPAN